MSPVPLTFQRLSKQSAFLLSLKSIHATLWWMPSCFRNTPISPFSIHIEIHENRSAPAVSDCSHILHALSSSPATSPQESCSGRYCVPGKSKDLPCFAPPWELEGAFGNRAHRTSRINTKESSITDFRKHLCSLLHFYLLALQESLLIM